MLTNGVVALATLRACLRRCWPCDLAQATTGLKKVNFLLVGLACVVLCWISIHWHLIGPVRVQVT